LRDSVFALAGVRAYRAEDLAGAGEAGVGVEVGGGFIGDDGGGGGGGRRERWCYVFCGGGTEKAEGIV
jgi:hypothetical protein